MSAVMRMREEHENQVRPERGGAARLDEEVEFERIGERNVSDARVETRDPAPGLLPRGDDVQVRRRLQRGEEPGR